MIVRYTPRAIADLNDIADYLLPLNAAAALAVEAGIRGTIGHLADHPLLGRDRPDLAARALGVPRFPYTIYYRIAGDTVAIVHIRDDRRQPPASLGSN